MVLTEADYELEGNDFWEAMQNEMWDTLYNIRVMTRLKNVIARLDRNSDCRLILESILVD